ncbi:hypothetical protein FQN57_004902 [Myotisia sp. PD_48]|nr:hypothetical protein FQN57_004902 [Myotisia sp. PD_48]
MHQTKKRKTSHDQKSSQNELVETAAKPSAVFTPQGGRSYTLSVALPGSIVANAKSHDQKTYLAGAIARALAVFGVDEIVVFEDDEQRVDNYNPHDPNGTPDSPDGYTAFSDPSHFLSHILSYLETPPHLRKYLFPMHPNLRTAGTLPSLDMPHHVRASEWGEYREGVVVGPDMQNGEYNNPQKKHKDSKKKKSGKNKDMGEEKEVLTTVNVGLPDLIHLPGISIPEHTRLTLKFRSSDPSDGADPVSPSAPREETGYYWGYSVRRCGSLSSVFTDSPFDGGYDLSIGMSERGKPLPEVLEEQNIPRYKHLLLVFGGVGGIEAAVQADRSLADKGVTPTDADKLFDFWVNLLPGQGSRTIRTEEAVWLGLMGFRRVVDANSTTK